MKCVHEGGIRKRPPLQGCVVLPPGDRQRSLKGVLRPVVVGLDEPGEPAVLGEQPPARGSGETGQARAINWAASCTESQGQWSGWPRRQGAASLSPPRLLLEGTRKLLLPAQADVAQSGPVARPRPKTPAFRHLSPDPPWRKRPLEWTRAARGLTSERGSLRSAIAHHLLRPSQRRSSAK